MAYYHDLITEKSWKFLQDLKRNFNFILIGGWAVFLYTKGLKSKDIDIICDYTELEKLKTNYELVKNERLKKYEIHAGEFDIDIYVPYYSKLGIPVEAIQKNTRLLDGFSVPTPEALLILKQKAWQERKQSLKGEKDKIDIISLLMIDPDFEQYKALIVKYNLKEWSQDILKILDETLEVEELSINKHQFSRLKAKIIPLILAD